MNEPAAHVNARLVSTFCLGAIATLDVSLTLTGTINLAGRLCVAYGESRTRPGNVAETVLRWYLPRKYGTTYSIMSMVAPCNVPLL